MTEKILYYTFCKSRSNSQMYYENDGKDYEITLHRGLLNFISPSFTFIVNSFG